MDHKSIQRVNMNRLKIITESMQSACTQVLLQSQLVEQLVEDDLFVT